jgi:hypothetical protein
LRAKLEKAFAAAHYRQVLRIGPMAYSWRKDCLMAESVLLSTPNSSFRTGQIAIHHLQAVEPWVGNIGENYALVTALHPPF